MAQQESKNKKTAPKRAGRRVNKYKAYLTQATCYVCKSVFFSPSKRARHNKSGCKDMTGYNPARTA